MTRIRRHTSGKDDYVRIVAGGIEMLVDPFVRNAIVQKERKRCARIVKTFVRDWSIPWRVQLLSLFRPAKKRGGE